MAESPPNVLRTVAWHELFPWLILLRTFRIAISPALLTVATLAVLITPLGWYLGGVLFLTPEQRAARPSGSLLFESIPLDAAAYLPAGFQPALLDAYTQIAEPLARLFRLDLSLGEAAYYLFGFLCTIAIWSFPGGVITRKAIVQLATENPEDIRSSIAYACRRYLSYFLSPLYPLLVIALIAIPIAILGLLVWLLPGFGALVAGLLWVFVIIAGLVAAWLIGGLLFGWPLMWPTISAERDGDPFEAFSRSYSYVYGKPLHYFFYVVVAAAFGALCWAVVWGAAMLVQEFGFWALSWGSGGTTAAELRADALDFAAGDFRRESNQSLWNAGATLVGLFLALIHKVATAFRFTFFFTVASAIYLLLRRDVDEKEMDEIYVETPTETAPPSAAAAAIQED